MRPSLVPRTAPVVVETGSAGILAPPFAGERDC
jgi:hypothetical protein